MNGTRARLAAFALVFAGGAAAARVWIAHAPARIATDLAQPEPVATAWGAYGAGGVAVLIATVALATAVLAALARDADAGARAVLVTATVALAANLSWPATFSSDPYAYAAYGDLARLGFDPYRIAPAALHDPVLDAARVQWSGPFPVCVYGPAFVLLGRVLVAAFGNAGVAPVLWAFRGVACAAFLGSIALLAVALRDVSQRRRSLALCAYGLNPVALWTVAEGHNDAVLLLIVTAGVALARTRASAGAFVLALGPLVKAPGVALAAAWGVAATMRRAPGATRTIGGLVVGTAVAGALALPPLGRALAAVRAHGTYAPQLSPLGLLGPAGAALLALAFAAAALAALRRGGRDAFAWGGLAIVAALPNVYPWYVTWLVPLTLLAGPGLASVALWSATILAVLRYLPDATGTMPDAAVTAAAFAAVLPLAAALGGLPAAFRKRTTPRR